MLLRLQRRACSVIVIAMALMACADRSPPNPGFDFSAMAPFWDVQSTLAADRQPSETQWSALLSTHGYRALTASEFSPDFFRRHFALAFMPSRAADRDTALAGRWGSYLRHYRHVAEERERLNGYMDSLASTPVTPGIVERAAAFLPPGGTTGNPAVAFVIFADDGRGYDPIVVDLQSSRNRDMEPFLAHEFHHWFRNRLLVVDLAAVDSMDYDVVWTLNQLQAEGIADQIDKRDWAAGASDPPMGRSGYTDRYVEHVRTAPALLRQLDSLFATYPEADPSRMEIGRTVRGLVPQSGHPTGFFMASLIEEQLGLDALIADVGNPFAFVRTYDRAAAQANQLDLRFSPRTLDLVDELERRYAAPAP